MKKLFIIYCFFSITAIHADVEFTREEYIALCNQALHSITAEKRALLCHTSDDTRSITPKQNKLEEAAPYILNNLNALDAPVNQHLTMVIMTRANYDISLSYINL